MFFELSQLLEVLVATLGLDLRQLFSRRHCLHTMCLQVHLRQVRERVIELHNRLRLLHWNRFSSDEGEGPFDILVVVLLADGVEVRVIVLILVEREDGGVLLLVVATLRQRLFQFSVQLLLETWFVAAQIVDMEMHL